VLGFTGPLPLGLDFIFLAGPFAPAFDDLLRAWAEVPSLTGLLGRACPAAGAPDRRCGRQDPADPLARCGRPELAAEEVVRTPFVAPGMHAVPTPFVLAGLRAITDYGRDATHLLHDPSRLSRLRSSLKVQGGARGGY
jgi:hypothetical protein